MNKQWIPIEGTGGKYFINKSFKIASIKQGVFKIMKPYTPKNGYASGCFMINGKQTGYLLHRIIAKTFIPNPQNKPCVNHKNGIKSDNRIENLEWVTSKENTIHGYRNGLIEASYGMLGKTGIKNKKSKQVNQIDVKTGKVIKVWDSLHCPTREKFWDFRNIHACVSGKRPTAYGYIWRYAS